MKDIYLVNCCRTAVGSFGGSLKGVHAADMGAIVVKEALKRANVQPDQVDELMFGCCITAALGQNVARQVSIKAGLPVMVGADQYHWAHIPVHAQLLSEVKQQVAQGLPEGAQVKLDQDDENRITESDIDPELLAAMPDPDGLMRTLVAAMEHVRQHAQYGGAQIGMQDAAKGVERMLKNMAPTIKALNLAIATRQRVMQAQAEAEERERAELEKRADETEFRKEARK